jgi:hypothetical protein
MASIYNVDLREALTAIAKTNTFYHLENDIKISFDQMEIAAKMGDYTDKAFIWVSYPSGIDCYNEREVLQKDTRGYNGVLYHGKNAENEPRLAYSVDVGDMKEGIIYGNLHEIDIREFASHVKDNAVISDKMQIFLDDVRRKDKREIMPLAEFNSRYPLDLPKMEHWRNLPADPVALDRAVSKAWDLRLTKREHVTIWQHTDKLTDKQLVFYAQQLEKELATLKEPNSTGKKSFIVPLDAYASHNFNPEQLSRLLDKLPYENAALSVQKGQRDMKLIVPKNEMLDLRRGHEDKSKDKSEKPSLMAAIDAGAKRSKSEFSGKAQPGVDTPEKSAKPKNNSER